MIPDELLFIHGRFERLRERYAPALRSFLHARYRLDASAADVHIGAAFAELAATTTAPAHLRPWLFSKVAKAFVERQPPQRATVAIPSLPALDSMRRRLGFLGEADREAVAMVAFGGASPAFAAQALGIPVGALETRLKRGLRKLATLPA